MARFRGTVKGGRGEASRLGHATSGLQTRAAGWHGSVTAHLFVIHAGTDDEQEWANVFLETDKGSRSLYYGPLNKYKPPQHKVEMIKLFDHNDPTE